MAGADCNESGAHGHFGFAKSNIATHQPVHRRATGHVAQNVIDGGLLIGGFFKRKGLAEGAVLVLIDGKLMSGTGAALNLGDDDCASVSMPFTTALFPSSPRPEDTEGRAGTYPAVANETFESMGSAFEEIFRDPEAPTDPGAVVDQIVALTEMKAGTRPFRSVVGLDFGVRDRNAAVEPFDAAVLEAFGMTSFATLVPGGRK